jgi:hypothetical protein
MKKNLFTAFAGIFLLLATCTTSNAQRISDNVQPSSDFIPVDNTALKNTPVARDEVNSRVVKNFIRSYKNVSNEKWYKLRDGFVTMFDLGGIGYQVAYGKKGNWLHTIRSFDESGLSEDLRHMVKSIYYDCAINLVQQIDKPVDPTAYLIQLKSKTEIINLRIYDGEMTVLNKYSRSK